MTRYQRQHSGPNLSNGMIWILGICGVAYMVYKIVSCNHAIKAVAEYEMKEIDSGTNNSFEKGTLQGNVFSNNYFEFSLEIDTPWHILNKTELTHLIRERTNMLNETTGKDLSISKGADILLSLAIDTIETMPHILFSSLDMTMFPQIKNEKDYLEDYFKQVKIMYENYDVQITRSETGRETIGKKTFFTTLITIKAENFSAYQKRYSIKIKNRLLNLMTNYNSDVYSKECLKLLNNIRWE